MNFSYLVQKLINSFHATFAFKKHGKSEYFLGIKVKHLPTGSILLTLTKYIQYLLNRAKICNANGVTTLMLSSYKLSKHGSSSLPDPNYYKSMVETLQYIILTRPKIALSVNKNCHSMTSSFKSRWSIVKRIMRHLSGTIAHVLLLATTFFSHNFSLRAYNDSDWANDPDDRRSTQDPASFLD